MAGMYEQLLKQAEEKPSAYKSLLQQANSAAEEKKRRNAAIAAAYSDIINGASSSPGKGIRTADVVDSLGTAETAFKGGLLAGLPGAGVSMAQQTPKPSYDLDKVSADAQRLLELEQKAQRGMDPRVMAEYMQLQQELGGYYGDGVNITSEGLKKLHQDSLTDSNNAKIQSLSEEELRALKNYAASRRGGIDEVPAWWMRATDKGTKALIDKYGRDAVDSMAETWERQDNRRAAEAQMGTAKAAGEALGFGAIPFSVAAGIGGSLPNLTGVIRERTQGSGGYITDDPYHSGSELSYIAQSLNEGGMKKAPEQMLNLLELMGSANPYSTEMGNFNATPGNYTPQLYEASRGTRAGEVIDAVGAGAYQVVNTAADSVARAYLGGALLGPGTTAAKAATLGLAGVRSFGDTYNDVSEKGGTPGQAAILGLFNAGTEVATEYLPLEEWWKVAENGVDGVVPMLKAAVRQGAIEASQEEIGFLATSLAEYAVLREKSEYQVLKRELMAQGYSEEQAERMMWEEFGKQAAGVAVTSFFSGGLSEVGAAAFHSLMPGAVTTQTQEQADTQEAQPSAAPETQTQEQTQATVPDVETVPQEKTPLQKAQDYYRQNGTVSNSLARAILADSDSLAVLQEQADLQLGHTDSQRRNDVKAAVARLTGAAEMGQNAGTDLSESIAESIAETQTETQQTAQETEQSGNVDEAIGSALRGEQPTVQTMAQTERQTAPAAQEVQGQGQNGEAAQTEQQSQPQQTDMEHGAVGAAEAGFTGKDTYYDLIDKYGEKPARAGDDQSGRLVQVPERDTQGRHVTDFTSNAMGAQITSNDMAEATEGLIEIGALSFDRQTNQKAVEDAAAEIKKLGWAKARDRVRDHAFAGQSKDGEIAQAMLLYAHYNKVGDIDNASEMMVVLSTMANRAGRDLQLFSMFRKLTPEGKLMTLQKTIDRAIDKMNQNRGKRNQQGEIVISDEPRQMYMELATIAGDGKLAAADQAAVDIGSHLEEDKELAAETAIANYQKWGPRRPDANITTNDLVDEIGKRIANNLNQTAKEQNKTTEDILYEEIMRFVNDKVDQAGGRPKRATPKNQNLQTLADYYRYQPFFQNAWDNARARVEALLQTMPDDDPRVDVIYGFLNDFMGSMIENTSPVMRTGDYSNPQSTVRKAAGEAAKMAGIRMENATQRTEQAKAEMRDVLTQNAANKAEAARRIADIAVSSMGLDGNTAQEMAETITDAFYADLAQRGAARVQQLLTPKAVPEKVVKSIAQRLGELYNMGGFQDAQTRQAVMDTVFGEGSGVDVPDSLLETFVNAANDNLWDAEEKIYKWAGSQMRGTFSDKWRAWRYMAMLGNAKTQVRNVLGNIAFSPLKVAKDAVGAAMERVVLGRKRQNERTKAILNAASKNDRELIGWATADAKSRPVARAMEYSAQMGEDVSRDIILNNKRVFDQKGLEAVRKFVQKVPGVADMLFKNPHYAASLAGFLKARGYTAEQVRSGQVSAAVLAEGRTYAINEAMKATFNDSNAFSDAISAIGRGNNKNAVTKVLGAMAEGVLPFRRTPANIVVRFWEYSPMGLITTGAKAVQQLHDGKFSAATMIDGLASSFTGTALAVLGAAMAHGIFPFKLHGGVEDEDDKRRGIQSWSVEYERGGKTYTYTVDWLAPANLPLFFGAQLYEAFTEDAEETEGFNAFTKFLYACGTAFEPLMELSCLSGIADIVEAGKYVADGNALSAAIADLAIGYFTQGVPALLRQFYQASQQNKMTTFANAEDPLIKGIQKEAANLPFLGAMFQTEKLTPWGEEISRGSRGRRAFDAFLNPGTEMEVDTSALEDEISRLNSVLSDNVSPPDLPAKTLTYTDKEGKVHEDYRLTEEEWQTMARTQGQTERAMLEEIVDSDAYANMTDSQKGEVFKMVYEYAKIKARDEAVEGYDADYTEWMEDLQENGVEAIYRRMTTSDLTGGISDWLKAPSADIRGESLEEIGDALAVYDGMSEAEKTAMRDAAGGRAKYLLLAHDKGMDPEKFLGYYQHYTSIDEIDTSASDKAEKWSIYLQRERERGRITAAQEETLRENMKYWEQFPGQAVKVDQLREGGLDSDAIENIVGGIDLLRPLSGSKTVGDWQVYGSIAGSGESTADIDAAMLAYMPDYDPDAKSPNRTELKYQDIRELGYTPAQFIAIHDVYDDGGGKRAIINAINALPYVKSRKEAELLYYIFSGDYYKK